MKKIVMGAVGLAVVFASFIAMPAQAVTCPEGSARTDAKTYAECNLAESSTDLWDSVNAIITTIIAVLGIVTVIVIILGGVQYVLSQGDAGKLKKAKDMILYGIIGLVIALLAFAIVNFVLTNVFGGGGSSGGGGGSTTTVTSGGSGGGSD